jgi:hypothetical protein
VVAIYSLPRDFFKRFWFDCPLARNILLLKLEVMKVVIVGGPRPPLLELCMIDWEYEVTSLGRLSENHGYIS